ncbi:hypothetical protein ACI2JA_04090 [Alkalihalobacillus sp. NPDC078783]
MPTPFSQVYGMFLSSVTSWDYVELSEEARNANLKQLLIKSIAQFDSCKNAHDIDLELDLFKETLQINEMMILSELMVVEYLTPIVISDDLMNDHFTPKELKTFSTANLLKELRTTRDEFHREALRKMNSYSVRQGMAKMFKKNMGQI